MGRPTTGGGSRATVSSGKVSSSDSKVWANSKTQVKFRDAVLKAAIKSRVDRKRTQYKSLKESELEKVPGSKVEVAIAAAAPAGKFLAAAKKALTDKRAEAQRRKDASKAQPKATTVEPMDDDILATVDIKISGYRSVESEKTLWKRYFGGYYTRTGDKRSELKDPHGKEAVKLMVKFISPKKAPPGFSHHTKGVSIDFFQMRKDKNKEEWVKNSTVNGKNPGQMTWWYATWIYSWLHDNATTYGFKELASEAWHYDYVGVKTK